MKTYWKWIVMMMASLAFVACSDDEDENSWWLPVDEAWRTGCP